MYLKAVINVSKTLQLSEPKAEKEKQRNPYCTSMSRETSEKESRENRLLSRHDVSSRKRVHQAAMIHPMQTHPRIPLVHLRCIERVQAKRVACRIMYACRERLSANVE